MLARSGTGLSPLEGWLRAAEEQRLAQCLCRNLHGSLGVQGVDVNLNLGAGRSRALLLWETSCNNRTWWGETRDGCDQPAT